SACLIPIAVNPKNTQQLYVGDACGGGVFRSDDGGGSWVQTNEGLGDIRVTAIHLTAIAVNPDDPKEVWVGTRNEGVYRSTDSGGTWTASRVGLGYRWVHSLVVDPTDRKRLFAAVDDDGVVECDE